MDPNDSNVPMDQQPQSPQQQQQQPLNEQQQQQFEQFLQFQLAQIEQFVRSQGGQLQQQPQQPHFMPAPANPVAGPPVHDGHGPNGLQQPQYQHPSDDLWHQWDQAFDAGMEYVSVSRHVLIQ